VSYWFYFKEMGWDLWTGLFGLVGRSKMSALIGWGPRSSAVCIVVRGVCRLVYANVVCRLSLCGIELAQDRVQWQALVLAVLKLCVLLPES
jgi:hypothetical protein